MEKLIDTLGNKEKELDALVPYWMLLNEGGVIQGHPRGYFTDGQPQAGNGGGSASFEYDADGPRMDPIKPMEGIHYLEDMYQWVDENFQQYISDCIDQTRGLTSNDIESE